MPDGSQNRISADLLAVPPRAGHFIVTLYGDVVEPRGGTLWMGRVIALCQSAGLSESLVRTAMSRLVAAGQLVGERKGRRSYYRLTPDAQIEFVHAAKVLFSRPDTPAEFAIRPMIQGLPLGFVPLRPDLAIGPYHANLDLGSGLIMRVTIDQGAADLPSFVAGLWDLDPLTQAYHAFMVRFTPLSDLLKAGEALPPQEALITRLLLVDGYRAVVLRDPLLPAAALPPNWPGWTARALFLDLYLRLSAAADSYIQQEFLESEGLDLQETPQVVARKAILMAEAGWKTV